jgi:hypothetical protein
MRGCVALVCPMQGWLVQFVAQVDSGEDEDGMARWVLPSLTNALSGRTSSTDCPE